MVSVSQQRLLFLLGTLALRACSLRKLRSNFRGHTHGRWASVRLVWVCCDTFDCLSSKWPSLVSQEVSGHGYLLHSRSTASSLVQEREFGVETPLPSHQATSQWGVRTAWHFLPVSADWVCMDICLAALGFWLISRAHTKLFNPDSSCVFNVSMSDRESPPSSSCHPWADLFFRLLWTKVFQEL